ncbi:MAG: zinc-binding dehydrogenase [bacterium]
MRSVYFEKSIPRVLATLGLKKITRRAVSGPWSPIRFQDLPEPPLPGPHGIRVKNRQCGVCATDLHLISVDVDPKTHPAALPTYDRIYIGHEAVGEVTEVGDAVTDLEPGRRVLMQSAGLGPTCLAQSIEPLCVHCQQGDYGLCSNVVAGLGTPGVGGGWSDGYTCHESAVWPLPDELDDDRAMLLEPLSCGVRAALRRRPERGAKVLVIGCGIIGLGTVQALRVVAPGAEVFAAARYPHQAALAERYGATVITDPDLLKEAARVTGATLCKGELGVRTLVGGFDVIYDCVGTGPTIEQSLRMTRAHGAVVVVGVHLHRVRVDLTPVFHQEVDLVGSLAHGAETWDGERVQTFELTGRWIQEGKLSTDDLITHRFPLGDWKRAVRISGDKRNRSVKVVLDCRR